MNEDVIKDINEIPPPYSFRRALVFGTAFSLLLISIVTAKNMWDNFMGKPPNIFEISLLLFSAWGILYVVFLWISFFLVVIKKLPGCVWTAISHDIHICLDSVLNARLDIEQKENGISPSIDEENFNDYLQMVLKEVKKGK